MSQVTISAINKLIAEAHAACFVTQAERYFKMLGHSRSPLTCSHGTRIFNGGKFWRCKDCGKRFRA